MIAVKTNTPGERKAQWTNPSNIQERQLAASLSSEKFRENTYIL